MVISEFCFPVLFLYSEHASSCPLLGSQLPFRIPASASACLSLLLLRRFSILQTVLVSAISSACPEPPFPLLESWNTVSFWKTPRVSHLGHHLTEKTPGTFVELHTPKGLTKNNVTLGFWLSICTVGNCGPYFWNPCYLVVYELSGLPDNLPTKLASPLTRLDLGCSRSEQPVQGDTESFVLEKMGTKLSWDCSGFKTGSPASQECPWDGRPPTWGDLSRNYFRLGYQSWGATLTRS